MLIGLMLSCHQCRLLLLIIIAVTLLFTSYLFVAYSNCNIVVASMMSSVLLTVFLLYILLYCRSWRVRQEYHRQTDEVSNSLFLSWSRIKLHLIFFVAENWKLGLDWRLRCRQIVQTRRNSSKLSPTSREFNTHRRRDSTRQLSRVGVGGVYWA